MSSLDLVDPEQRSAVVAFPPFNPKEQALEEFRSGLVAGMTSLLTPEPVEWEECFTQGRDGHPPVRLLIHRPNTADQSVPAIVYLHGGGMIAGTPDMMAGAHHELSLQSGVVIIAVDYRLAPETRFPGALEDTYTAISHVHENARELGINPARISIMGDSGGGCLAAAATLMARDRGEYALRSQILIYPMLDAFTGSSRAHSDDPLTGEFIWSRAQNRFAWNCITGGEAVAANRQGYLSPALAGDLAGLPPTFILAGALDLFRDENIAFAQRLLRSAVPTELHLYAGAVHGFDILPGELSLRARAEVLTAVRRLA